MILDELLAMNIIDLSKSKRLNEINKVNNPKYYKFHHVICHLIEKYFILKERIMTLVSEGKIIIYMNKMMDTNHAYMVANEKKFLMSQTMSSTILLHFENFKLVEVDIPRRSPEGSIEIDDNLNEDEDNDWTLVSHKK